MNINLEKEAIRFVVREELQRQQNNIQRLCAHAKTGTLRTDGVVICDDCEKPLSEEDAQTGYTEEPNTFEESLISNIKDGRYK